MAVRVLVALVLGAFLAATFTPAEARTRVRVAVKVDATKVAPFCPPRIAPSGS